MIPSAFKDSIREVCRPPPDEAALYEANPAMDALKRRMNQGRRLNQKQKTQGTREPRVVDDRIQHNEHDERLLKDPRLDRAGHAARRRSSVGPGPVVCRDGECRVRVKARSDVVPRPPVPPRKQPSMSFKEALGCSFKEALGCGAPVMGEPPVDCESPHEGKDPFLDTIREEISEDYPGCVAVEDTKAIGVDLSEASVNHAFTLLNSEVDGDTEPLPVPGWTAIHEFLTDTMDDPEALTIMYNTERRPFGQGVIDAVYWLDRGSMWEAVSRGFTEVNLYKETTNDGVNGYGFELVMRVAKTGADCPPPPWVMDVMAALLKTHASGEMEIALGDVFDIDEELIREVPGAVSLAITRDPKWREKLKTSFGSMCFYQVVPLSDKEGSLALDLGTNIFLKTLYFGQVPVIDAFRKDSSGHVLWSRFKDEVDLGDIDVDGLAVLVRGAALRVAIPPTSPTSPPAPLLVFRLLLALVHDLPTTWVNPKTDLKCVWLRHNMRQTTNPDHHKSPLHHIIYVSSEGVQALFDLFDTKASEWADAVRDSPPWPLVIENEPRLELTLK